MSIAEYRPSGLLFGAAYYAEYQPYERLEADLDLMRDANFTVIRVGESVWSTWEPRQGEYDVEWLRPVLDGAHARGIKVLLGTPTYAIPPWLQVLHPELAAEKPTGVRVGWGGRQEADFSSPHFRAPAEAVVRRIMETYSDHPAVIGYQIDNEPGLRLYHNPSVFRRFVGWLRERYGDVATLNREWGLVYWSHRIADWNELWTPDGNTVPQYDLAWRRFQAELTTEFIRWQTDIVREYRREGQFITTCMAYYRPALDDVELMREMDVTGSNCYYSTQDHLSADLELPPGPAPTTTGYWGLLRQADRFWASRQNRFLVTETNAGSVMGSWHNYPPYPGQLEAVAFALVARGAAMIEYWHWHTNHYGTETWWGGVLPHSGRPGRIHREVSALGKSLAELGTSLDDYVPDADVAILFDKPSLWAFEFFPPLRDAEGMPDPSSYQRIFDAFYRGCVESGAQVRVLHPQQLGDPTELAATTPVLVVPGYFIADDEVLKLLHRYAEAGGHLVLGPRSGYGDLEARARWEVAPAHLAGAAGASFDEYTNLDMPVRVVGGDDWDQPGAAGTAWAEVLRLEGAATLATFGEGWLQGSPAVTTQPLGAGHVTIVGTIPNPTLAEALMRRVVPHRMTDPWQPGRTVSVLTGTAPHVGRVTFLFNWSATNARITVPEAARFLVGAGSVEAGDTITLSPWECRVMAQTQRGTSCADEGER